MSKPEMTVCDGWLMRDVVRDVERVDRVRDPVGGDRALAYSTLGIRLESFIAAASADRNINLQVSMGLNSVMNMHIDRA